MITKAAQSKLIHGIQVSRCAPAITHLLFADDSLIFAKAKQQECSIITDISSLYERASGQKINMANSEICFSRNGGEQRRLEIVHQLGVKEVDRHSKYLGLPTIVGPSKKVVFASIKDRVWKKVHEWKEKLLSQVGRETLIKSVLQSIPIYVMSIFKLPDALIDEIHGMLARFWWGAREGERKIHWKSWDSLCLPKAQGGMGF